MTDFRMPSLGADMEAGTLVEWRVKPGDRVRRGDVIAVVETQKGAIEIEVFSAGVIAELVVPVGTQLPVGTVMARLDAAAAPRPTQATAPAPPPTRPVAVPPAAAAPAVSPPAAMPPVAEAPPAAPPVSPLAAPPPAAAAGHVSASPAARRRAAERGIALGRVAGSGPGGAVTLADVEAASAEAPPTPPPAPPTAPGPARRGGFDPAAMRQAIAAAMSRSKREIPHYYLSQTVEVTAALARLERQNSGRAPPDRLLPAALLLRATALALAKTPELNGFWEDGHFRPGDGVHIGWATSLRGGGLIAPAIRDADKRPLDELMAAMRDAVRRARAGGVRGSELTDPTITVSSLGERGAESVLPIINPPQVAMVGFGRIVTRPWVVDGAIGPRPVMTLTLAGDHRASDGHRGGLLLVEIDRLLQEAETL
ncbi:MAG TPA: dihydrolipoamide acetyltransferase family protein [Acetobacteraceae bacterium]|nr:dihydrolipoamide acetyltransferase family protein [Acetobacteraceae bacterium]